MDRGSRTFGLGTLNLVRGFKQEHTQTTGGKGGFGCTVVAVVSKSGVKKGFIAARDCCGALTRRPFLGGGVFCVSEF